MVQSVTFTMDEIAELSISIKMRETCGSSLAVLRVHVVLLNQASTLDILTRIGLTFDDSGMLK